MRHAFVSSTSVDLEKHRRYVIDALQDAGLAVDPMERWTAASDEPKQLSQDRVRGCDLCVLLVARRRGHIPQGETLSVTQLEVHAAEKLGPDVLVFMLDDDAFWKTEWDERASDPELMRWRAELQERCTTSYFNHEASSVEVGPAISRWFDKLSRTTEPGGTSEPAAASGTFVGRQHALTALKRLVTEEQERGSQRPIALVGMGGVGKTTLARELMRRLVDGYPGGELVLERPPAGIRRRPERCSASGRAGWASPRSVSTRPPRCATSSPGVADPAASRGAHRVHRAGRRAAACAAPRYRCV